MKKLDRAAVAIAITNIGTIAANVGASSTCGDCQPSTGYLVTELWNILPGTTDQEVIDAFNKGFAPKVTRMDGFYRYTAALTGNSSTVFFMNIFETADHARDAQEAAKKFVAEGSLNGKIYPNSFTEDYLDAEYTSPECVTTDSTGEYLATRLNQKAALTLYDGGMAGVTTANNFMETIPGYRLFLASISMDNTTSMFINIYETAEGAQQANDAILQQNAEQNYTMGEIYPVTDGQIKFDYLCVAGNAPDAYDDHKTDGMEMGGGGPPSSAFISNVYVVGVYGAIVAMSAGILFY
jgi:bacterioferritin-associated ferredoxin